MASSTPCTPGASLRSTATRLALAASVGVAAWACGGDSQGTSDQGVVFGEVMVGDAADVQRGDVPAGDVATAADVDAADVSDAHPPHVTIVSPAPDSAYLLEDGLTVAARLTDPDHAPDELRVTLESDVDGALTPTPLTPSADGLLDIPVNSLSEGPHALTVTATDPDGLTASASVSVRAYPASARPTVAIVTPSLATHPDFPDLVAGPVSAIAAVTDDADAPEQLQVAWRVDTIPGVLLDAAADADGRAALTYDDLPLGANVLTATVRDTSGLSAETSVTLHLHVAAAFDGDDDCYCVTGPCAGAVPAGCDALAPGDCNDTNPDVNPGLSERCDELDTDCDGVIPESEIRDLDGDKAVACNDCDDLEAAVHPGAAEVCDGLDNDCNSAVDDGELSVMCPLEPGASAMVCRGEAGCSVDGCAPGTYDVDGHADNGCECQDDDVGAAPEAATSLGVLVPGALAVTPQATVPVAGAQDWYRVEFPAVTRPGEGKPEIFFSANEADTYRFDVRAAPDGTSDCCPEVLDHWSFEDNADTPAGYLVNDTPWPNVVYVRVFREAGTPSCDTYELTILR